MQPKTILVDMDDTLENFTPVWVEYLNQKHHTNVHPEEITRWDIASFFPMLTNEEVFEPLHDPKLWDLVFPKEGAVYYMLRLINDGHKVFVCTTSYYKTLKEKMDKALFPYFPFLSWKDVIVTSNKQMIKADVLIDDGIHNLEGGEYTKLLMDSPANRDYDAEGNGMIRVHDWHEIYRTILTIPSKKGV